MGETAKKGGMMDLFKVVEAVLVMALVVTLFWGFAAGLTPKDKKRHESESVLDGRDVIL